MRRFTILLASVIGLIAFTVAAQAQANINAVNQAIGYNYPSSFSGDKGGANTPGSNAGRNDNTKAPPSPTSNWQDFLNRIKRLNPSQPASGSNIPR